jgi:hypothetical protein
MDRKEWKVRGGERIGRLEGVRGVEGLRRWGEVEGLGGERTERLE